MKCECGCGEEVAKPGNRFIYGHHTRCMSDDAKRKMSKPNLGRKFSEEHKRKISETNLGRKLSNEHKKKIGKANLGSLHTGEAKQKMSEMNRGENNPNWKGGVSSAPYCSKFSYKFKEFIRDKFGRACFLCGKSEESNGVRLSVHHVSYDKECLCTDVECEFVPLCMICHGKTSNGDREYYEGLINNKLESFI